MKDNAYKTNNDGQKLTRTEMKKGWKENGRERNDEGEQGQN